MLCGWNS
jgi:hypothetical protein